ALARDVGDGGVRDEGPHRGGRRTARPHPRCDPRSARRRARGKGDDRPDEGWVMSTTTRPRYPRFNHVAMSLPPNLLDEHNRADITHFYDEVFGWKELPMLTEDRHRLVLSCYTYEQFVFLIAEDESPMSCPRLDHYGISVATEQELDDMLARAKALKEKDDRVDIIDKK